MNILPSNSKYLYFFFFNIQQRLTNSKYYWEWWVSPGVCLLTKLKVINFLPKRSPIFRTSGQNSDNGFGYSWHLKICQFFYHWTDIAERSLIISWNLLIQMLRNVLPKWYCKRSIWFALEIVFQYSKVHIKITLRNTVLK